MACELYLSEAVGKLFWERLAERGSRCGFKTWSAVHHVTRAGLSPAGLIPTPEVSEAGSCGDPAFFLALLFQEPQFSLTYFLHSKYRGPSLAGMAGRPLSRKAWTDPSESVSLFNWGVMDTEHHMFQESHTMIWCLYILQNHHRGKSSQHPSPHTVTNIFFLWWELWRSILLVTFKHAVQYYEL